ncbi:MAG: HugZ family protein [Hyphomicrobium sp.]|uniref:HugZ family pyridoxamine 5'-phosphate oxidase n=1 Tax=Hyphomicrobium sp. TaxID=82 RepID=UPI003D142CD2
MADTADPDSDRGKASGPAAAQLPPGEAARVLMRRALKASLATSEASTGHPYASLVTIATDVDGTPLFLISTLALHTKNLKSDARASVLFDGTDAAGDPLAGGRVTVMGRASKTGRATARERFLARQPHAQGYADFPDFAFYELAVERAHYIGGFGRIVDLEPADLILDTADASALVAAHTDIVAHMNEDHAAAIVLYATELAGAPGGPWRMTGIDPEGFDIVCDGMTRRLAFTKRVTTPEEARQELIRLVGVAREQSSKG